MFISNSCGIFLHPHTNCVGVVWITDACIDFHVQPVFRLDFMYLCVTQNIVVSGDLINTIFFMLLLLRKKKIYARGNAQTRT